VCYESIETEEPSVQTDGRLQQLDRPLPLQLYNAIELIVIECN
jgi:hypothetical protein